MSCSNAAVPSVAEQGGVGRLMFWNRRDSISRDLEQGGDNCVARMLVRHRLPASFSESPRLTIGPAEPA